jgi:hypothetical protein
LCLQDAINYVVCARLRNAGLRKEGQSDDNAEVLRAIEKESDPIVKDIARMWYVLERAKKEHPKKIARLAVAVCATFVFGYLCGKY